MCLTVMVSRSVRSFNDRYASQQTDRDNSTDGNQHIILDDHLEQKSLSEIFVYQKQFDFQLTFVPPFDVYSHIVTALILIGEFFPRRGVMLLLMICVAVKVIGFMIDSMITMETVRQFLPLSVCGWFVPWLTSVSARSSRRDNRSRRERDSPDSDQP